MDKLKANPKPLEFARPNGGVLVERGHGLSIQPGQVSRDSDALGC